MNFKKLTFFLVLPLLAVTTLLFAVPFKSGVADEQARYTEGKEYVTAPKAIETQAAQNGQIEVREFFWYGCGHCYQALPFVEKWKETKAEDITFIETPALFSESWAVLGRGYYTAKALGILDEVHPALFNYVQKENVPVRNVKDLAVFFEKRFDVPVAKFAEINKSEEIMTAMQADAKLIRDYMISSVPTFVVGGKYITSASKAGTHAETLQVIEFLVEKVRQERAAEQ